MSEPNSHSKHSIERTDRQVDVCRGGEEGASALFPVRATLEKGGHTGDHVVRRVVKARAVFRLPECELLRCDRRVGLDAVASAGHLGRRVEDEFGW